MFSYFFGKWASISISRGVNLKVKQRQEHKSSLQNAADFKRAERRSRNYQYSCLRRRMRYGRKHFIQFSMLLKSWTINTVAQRSLRTAQWSRIHKLSNKNRCIRIKDPSSILCTRSTLPSTVRTFSGKGSCSILLRSNATDSKIMFSVLWNSVAIVLPCGACIG